MTKFATNLVIMPGKVFYKNLLYTHYKGVYPGHPTVFLSLSGYLQGNDFNEKP